MAAGSSRLDDFLNEVCEYIRTWSSYANAIDGSISLDKGCTEPYADFKKLLKLFYRALDPLHKEWFKKFFAEVDFDRTAVEKLLKCHYFKLKSKSKSVFICLLYNCSFTYSLLHYCEKNDMGGMLIQMGKFLKDEFPNIESRFTKEGGWDGLKKFCSSQNLPILLQFIRHCYCEKAIFHTFVLTTPSVPDFGLHGRETLDLLMNNVLAFEKSFREAFDKEINASLSYKQEVEDSFSKLRSDLQNGPFQNYLSRDTASISIDPTSPLSRI